MRQKVTSEHFNIIWTLVISKMIDNFKLSDWWANY